MTDRFDCDALGNMDEYVGCRLERNVKDRWIRITQPVQLQSFVDEFDLPNEKDKPFIPAEAGQVMSRAKENEGIGPDGQGSFHKGVGKLLHMMQWSRPNVLNSTRRAVTKHDNRNDDSHESTLSSADVLCQYARKRPAFKTKSYLEWTPKSRVCD
jgi:hypothetical protein